MSPGALEVFYQIYCIILIIVCIIYAVYAYLKGIRNKEIKNLSFKNIAFSFFIFVALLLLNLMYHYDHYIWSFEEVYRPILVWFALLFFVVGLFYPEKKIEEDEEFHNYVERKKWEKEQEKRKQLDLERQQQLKQAIEKSEQKKDEETP